MNYVTMGALLVLFSATYCALAEEVFINEGSNIDKENIPYLFNSRTDTSVSFESLAEMLSIKYKLTRDVNKKNTLMSQIRPTINKRLEDCKNVQNMTILIGGTIGDYNTHEQGISTGIDMHTYIPFGLDYAVDFENGDAARIAKLSHKKYLQLMQTLKDNQEAVITLTAQILKAEEKETNMRMRKVVTMHINHVDVRSMAGTKIADFAVK